MTGRCNSSELSPSILLPSASNTMQQGRKQKRNKRTVGDFVEKSFGDFEVKYGSMTSQSSSGSSPTGRLFSLLGLIESDKNENNEDITSNPASSEKGSRSFWAYATVLTILMTLVTSLYLPALALLCVRRTVFTTSGSLIRTLLLLGRFCTLALLVILPVPSSENNESDTTNQVVSNNNRSNGKLIGYLFQDRADAPKWIQNCVSIIEGNTVASTNNGKGDNRAWPPPALTALAVITLIAFVVHPDGPTWMLLGKLREGLQWLRQAFIRVYDMVRNCKIPNSIIAFTSIASFILLIGIIYRIVRMKDKNIKPAQQTEKVRHKHKKNKKGRGGGGRQNNNSGGGKAKLKNSHFRSNKESLNSHRPRSRSSSPLSQGPTVRGTDSSPNNSVVPFPTNTALTEGQTPMDVSKHYTQSKINSKIIDSKHKKRDTISTVSDHFVNAEDDKSCNSSLHSLSSSNSYNQYKKQLSGNQNSTLHTQKNYLASRPENSRRQRSRRGFRKTNSQANNQKNSPYVHFNPPSPKSSLAKGSSSVPTSPSTLQKRFEGHHPSNKGKRQNNRNKNNKRGVFSETSNSEISHVPMNSHRHRYANDSMTVQNPTSPCSPLDLNISKHNNMFTNNQNRNKMKPIMTSTRLVGVCKEESNKTTVYPTSRSSQQNCSEAIPLSSYNMETRFSHINKAFSSTIDSNHEYNISTNQIGSVSNTYEDQANIGSRILNSALNYNVPNYANSYSFSHGYHGRYSPGKMELAGFLAQVGLVGSSCAGILADLNDVDALEKLSNAQFLRYNISYEKRRHIDALLQARRRRNTIEKHDNNSWKTADLKCAALVRPPPGLEFNNETVVQSEVKCDNSNVSILNGQLKSIPVRESTNLCDRASSFNENTNTINDKSLNLGLPFYQNQGYGFQRNGQANGIGMISTLAPYNNKDDISSNNAKSHSPSMNIFNEDEIEADMQELGGQMAVSILDF